MKPFLLIFLVRVGAAELVRAADLRFKVTNETLVSWQATGIDPNARNKPGVTLPAGAQISRTFSGGTVILHAIFQPDFAQKNTDWPIVSVGPVALVFKQEDAEGRIALVDADGAIKNIPGSFPIDAAGKSTKPIDLAFAYDPGSGTAVIALGDQLQSFQLAGGSSSVEVLLLAGADTPWFLDNLEVELTSADKAGDDMTSNDALLVGGPKESGGGKSAILVKEFFADQTRAAISEGSILGSTPPVATSKGQSTLEVFTPPSARNLSADTLRALVRKAQAK